MNSELVVRRKSLLLIVFLVVFIDLLGFGMVLPLMPVYAKQFTADYPPGQQVMVLTGLMVCFSVMQLVFAPLWGRVSDCVGRRPVLLLSLTGSTFFYAMFGMATLWRSLPWMFVARIGAGIAGATIPTAQACIADATPPEKRARGMALIGAAFGLGFTLGPLLGALALWTAGDVGLSPWPGYTASGFSAIALVLALVRLPESLDPQNAPDSRRHFDFAALREAFATPSIGLLLATAFLTWLALANFESTISFTVAGMLGVERSSPNILVFFAFVGLVQCLVQGVIVRWLAVRIGEAAMSVTGGLIAILGFVLLALAADPRYGDLGRVRLGSAVTVSGLAFLMPAVQSLISRRTAPAKQGGVLGVGESVSGVARILGYAVGVGLYHQMPAVPFWTAAGLMCLALALVSSAVRRGRDWQSPAGAASAT